MIITMGEVEEVINNKFPVLDVLVYDEEAIESICGLIEYFVEKCEDKAQNELDV